MTRGIPRLIRGSGCDPNTTPRRHVVLCFCFDFRAAGSRATWPCSHSLCRLDSDPTPPRPPEADRGREMRIESTAGRVGWMDLLARSFVHFTRSINRCCGGGGGDGDGGDGGQARKDAADEIQVVFDCSQRRRSVPLGSWDRRIGRARKGINVPWYTQTVTAPRIIATARTHVS